MSYADTPDNQRGTVAADLLVAAIAAGQPNATVEVPVNCKALWLVTGPTPDPTVTVTGAGTGVVYPVYAFWTQDVSGDFNLCAVVFISSQADVSAHIHWAVAPAGEWLVIADDGDRFTLDAAIAAATANPGTVNPLYAVQVAGSDGTSLRTLKTDATGALAVTGSTFPPVYGPPGAALPADALLAAGSDGTDLRALLTDATGRLLVAEAKLELAIAALGAALPADALLVAGSDGIDLRAVLTDVAGHQLTVDQTLKFAIGAPTATDPTEAVFVGFTDGANLRVPITSKSAVQYAIPSAPSTAAGDHPPVECGVVAGARLPSATVLLPAPGAGKRYRVFSIVLTPETTGNWAEVQDTLTPAAIMAVANQTGYMSYGPTGIAIATNAPLAVLTSAGLASVTMCYTTETV